MTGVQTCALPIYYKRAQLLGRNVKVIIPTPSGEKEIDAKVDTGAWSSSIDTNFFESLGLNEKVIKNKLVRDVSGEEKRDVYEIELIINGQKINSEINVIDRSQMKYKMILGRKDIRQLDAIVDVTKKDN